MPAEPYTDVDYKADQVLIAHQSMNNSSCLCGWAELGRGHPLHVWRELQRAVLPDHDARVRADQREVLARMLVDHAAREPDGSVDQVVMLHAAELVRTHAATPTTEEDPHA